MYNYFKLKVLLVMSVFLIGCSVLEERWVDTLHESESTLICRPADAVGCIGWAKDKSIVID